MIYGIGLLLLYGMMVTYILVVQLKREKKLVDITNNVVERMEKISEIIISTKETLGQEKLAEAFSNDDEVGRFFSQMKEIQENLSEYVLIDNRDEEVE